MLESFEQQAINKAPKKPMHWHRYVDDMFVVWSHGDNELQIFLQHLNSLHPSIKFMMELEKDKKLLFLDVLVKKSDGSRGHLVSRKPTHTDLYLHAESEHHSAQIRAILSTLVHHARGSRGLIMLGSCPGRVIAVRGWIGLSRA